MAENKSSALFTVGIMTAVDENSAFHLFNVFGQQLGHLMTLGLEMILRRKMGTRYYHLVQLFTYLLWTQTYALAAVLLGMIMHFRTGLFGMGAYESLNLVCFIYHVHRLLPKIRNMRLEDDSKDEGDPWWFIQKLPKGNQYAMSRAVYEPCLVLIVTYALYFLHIIDGPLAFFLVIGAVALALKCGLRSLSGWMYVRDMFDNEYRAKQMQKILRGESKATNIGPYQFEALKNVSTEVKAQVIQKMTGLTPELAELVTKGAN